MHITLITGEDKTMIYFHNILLTYFLIVCLICAAIGVIWLATDLYETFFVKELPELPKEEPWKVTSQTIQLTDDLLAFINHLIEYETFSELLETKILHTEYDVRLMDKGVEHVSTKVYHYLRPEVFDTPYVIRNESIMNYIVDQTKNFFVTTVAEHNDKIRIG